MSIENIPKHIAIIMDGNGRWAEQKKLPRILGYKQGIKTAQKIIEYCKNLHVEYLTLYAFSLENWQRPKDEVEHLMEMFRDYLNNDVEKLINKGIRVIFIGNHKMLDDDIQAAMKSAEEKSSTNNFCLIIAFSYGARDEILRAVVDFSNVYDKSISKNMAEVEKLFISVINPYNIPDPDLLIRTSGERRLSNFLLWHIAYTELFFTDKFWPDFKEEDLLNAIKDFKQRERRYGK
jgi:undecaprenyl diphosphate synthase